MEADDRRAALQLVRNYSWDVDERIAPTSGAYALSQALIDQRENLDTAVAPWKALLGPSDTGGRTE
jgi:hypothetical protein